MKLGLSILVIDDDVSVLETMQAMLTSLGAGAVEQASSAEQALNRLDRDSFELILSDYQMEGMSGVDLTRVLRDRGDRTPILLFSGAPERRGVLEAMRHPGVDFFGKPFRIHELTGAMDRLLAGQTRHGEPVKTL